MRNRTLSRPAVAVALFLLILAAAASAKEWRPAPLWGADVRSLAIHPEDPDLVLAGTSAGQVYLSKNGGKRWSDAGPALPFPGWVVSALRFDPNRPSRIWASLWGIWGSGHVAFSDDLGKSWVSRAKGLPDEPVYSLALVPGREGRLYAGTLSGVYGSTDDGESWRYLTGDLPEIQKVTSLLVDTEAGTVIAGTWRRAYRSGDDGKTWAGIFDGMVLDSEVFSLTPIPGRPGEIWATTCGWVYQSKNGGDKWERFKDGFTERRTPSFAALPDGRLLAGTVAGLHVSEDGKNWKLAGDPALAIHTIAHHPARPGRVILATEGSGVWISEDGAANFRRSSAGMTNTRVSALALSGDDVIVALSHAGPLSGAYVSKDRGRTWAAEFAPLPTVLELAASSGRVYAATERGLYERRGSGWFRLKELGEGRVEQVAIHGERVVARTAGALYELAGGRFVPRPFKEGTPRSIAFFGDALWVSDGKGLYQLLEKANTPVAAPPAPMSGGRLQRLQDQLLLWGPGGAWLRGGPDSLWVELTGKPSRVLPTGDPRFPALMVSGETARLYDREARKFRILEVPVPARDVSAALVVDGKLLMGTSGYGLLIHELAPAVEKPVAVAAGGGTE
ncbi:MAG TPA: hypothetical protein VEL74_11175 [Thermoanaerobaculia bacterium]|nr:hypothetical protein [Thermoanaerobaculia bacterium]